MIKFYKAILWYGIAAILVFSPIARGAMRIWAITPVLLTGFTLVFIWLLFRDSPRIRFGTVPEIEADGARYAYIAIRHTGLHVIRLFDIQAR